MCLEHLVVVIYTVDALGCIDGGILVEDRVGREELVDELGMLGGDLLADEFAETDEENALRSVEIVLLELGYGLFDHKGLALGRGLLLELDYQLGGGALFGLGEVLVEGGPALSVGEKVVGKVGEIVSPDELALDVVVVIDYDHIVGGQVNVTLAAPEPCVLRRLERCYGVLAESARFRIPETAVRHDGDTAALVD